MSKYSYSRFLDDCEALIKLSKHQNNKGGECFGQWQRREGLQKVSFDQFRNSAHALMIV